MSVTREQFVSAARAYLGAPYLHQGWSVTGMDCRGLLLAAARDCGVLSDAEIQSMPELMNYQRHADGETMSALLRRYCDYRQGDLMAVEVGDIVAIKYEIHPQHLIIVTRPTKWGPMVIHATDRGVIEHRLDDVWLKSNRARVHGVFSLTFNE